MFYVLLSMAVASAALVPKDLSVPSDLGLKSFEPSAALYLPDLKMFLLASDDTTKDDDPLLFLLDQQGRVQRPAIRVGGLAKMTDIESLSLDGRGRAYLLSSLGVNKNGSVKAERNLFVRAVRQGSRVVAEKAMDLRTPLLRALAGGPAFAGLKDVEGRLDVEAHFIRDGRLYLGLKEPQPHPGQALIVRAGSVDDIFQGNLQLEPWRTINFAAVSGDRDLLSDMIWTDSAMLLTTTQERGASRLWRYDPLTQALSLLEEFEDARAEGLALSENELLLVFDQGEDTAQFALGSRPNFRRE